MHQQPHFEHRVREFAYQIWESEGKPDGQADRHWEMAWKLAEAQTLGEQLLDGNATPAKVTRSRKKAEPNGATDEATQEASAKAIKKASADKAEKPAKAAKAEKPAKAVKAETAKADKPAKAAKAPDDVEKPKKAKKTKTADSELTAN